MTFRFSTPARGILILVFVVSTFGVTSGFDRAQAAECSAGWVALTFDDGPVPGRSEMVLDVLNETGTPATFFSIGSRIARYPALAIDMASRGHVMANHTWTHLDLTSLTADEVASSVRRTDTAFRAIGIQPLRLVRPPFLRTDETVLNALEQSGFTQILETVNSKDWSDITPQQMAERVMSAARDGAVIGLHDGHKHFEETAIATEIIIEQLTDKGFCFGVLDEGGNVVQSATSGPGYDVPLTVTVNEMVWIKYLMGA